MNSSKRKRTDRRESFRKPQRPNSSKSAHNDQHQHHRFGRVMSQPPKLKLHCGHSSPCHPTVSIAVPGSVVSNAQTRELQTQLAGQIARAAAVFRVDEVVVFDDGLGSKLTTLSNYRRGPINRNKDPKENITENGKPDALQGEEKCNITEGKEEKSLQPSTDPHSFLARILQYCECPQYLRRKFFPMHPDLQFAGLLPPLDAPHHLRRGDTACFREGVVVESGVKDGGDGGSFVDCGVPNRLVQIDRVLTPGIRCTVRLDPHAYESRHKSQSNKNFIKGKVVSPTTPRDDEGIYWGYTTRIASSISAIFEECPYEGGYDLKVGTSERGDISIDDPQFCLTSQTKKAKLRQDRVVDERFNHLIIVFGGVAGIEESVDADESMKLSGENSKKLFDIWVNICPYQGSRTIRTEEAVMIALSRLSPFIAKNGSVEKQNKGNNPVQKAEDIHFSDDALSEESSDDE